MNWIGIAGPTASGKTAAALALASVRPVEIVSVDSALVYRGMDLGTAKPTPAERAAVPHHLIDIRDPLQAYSAAEFVADATRLIAEITARDRLPLLVGGTMLYFKALMDGIDDMPSSDAGIRAQVDAEAVQRGWPAMHAELMTVDPITAARLAPHDAQRIQRALEVHRISGRPLSSFHTARAVRGAVRADEGVLLVSLEPRDRGWLHQRIAERFDAMLAAGFVGEVGALRTRGDLDPTLASMRCVGYRQAWEMLDASPDPSPGQWAEMREKGIAATRQLAKRQMTWLRSMPHRRVVDCDAPDATQRVVDLVLAA